MTDVLSELGKRTLVMGILNVTPDSFSDGGRFYALADALAHARRLIAEGADILDIGGESTRPGAEPVSLEEELRRVVPVVRAVRQEFPKIPISVDTYKATVAEAALEAGATILNDISALRFDPQMVKVAARARVPVVLMHMKGTPQTMQQNPTYDDVVGEIKAFLRERIALARSWGIEQIWIDPGIGFGKRVAHNIEILRRLSELRDLGCPILIGTSRKFFIGRLGTARAEPLPVTERLEGTIASTVIAVLNGAQIVRVHDVAAMKKALAIADAVRYGWEEESYAQT
ncbi:MAG: dihydropteroate synthase [Candidatus Bipolaricaulota bacterium]|nr:dihydropteroate synthase [Candidatus Bipolaricaulota bacterium]MCS7273798.1 dihydropteroate synthase [Candidatus Bipolaricaulota bacterium]MDW8111129.1 dihydropteroate synthase [Candidatus Bipolaricaulota bacterium]MDW8329757.1 dihydropteroate synthase [Candidatus Bipolaricaulota bacterium]